MYTEVVKIIALDGVQSGTSKSGIQWKKLLFVGETFEQYPRKLAFLLFNDNVDKNMIMLEVGAEVEVSFVAESREYNGKYYTDLRAINLVPREMRGQGNQPQQQPQSANIAQNSGASASPYPSAMPQQSVPQPDGNLPF